MLCEIEGCDRPRRGRTPMCNKHRIQAWRHGDPLHQRWGTPQERLDALSYQSGECRLMRWTNPKTGYGQFWLNRQMLAHRAAYILAHGEVPEGLQLDHLCRNKACVNPAHLEPVTAQVNTRRYHDARRKETQQWAQS